MSCRLTVAVLGTLIALTLAACSSAPPRPVDMATVAGITEGRGGEKVFLLRTASGRTYLVTQTLDNAPNVGDSVEIERSAAPRGTVQIKAR